MRRTPLSSLAYLASNVLSLIGVVLVTTAGILWLLALPIYWRGIPSTPYIGILLFLILPAVFVIGLILMPAGIALQTWKRRRAGDSGPFVPAGSELRRLAIFVGVTTAVNLLIGSQFSYRAVTFMETESFCGQACHTVMQPEFTAHAVSAHSNVGCTECHIGPGVTGFLKAKMSGTTQLVGVVLNNYPRPVPVPVHSLHSAVDACEKCHSPERYIGNKFFVHTEYATDEQNSATTTVALLKVGGHDEGGTVGIHGAHVDPKAYIDFISTGEGRQTIPQVTYTDAYGKVTVFNSTDAKPKAEDLARGEHRQMDCMDCHNRPTHTFHLPERALDVALSEGGISAKLPFIKKQALEALKRPYPDRDTARREIAASMDHFYKANYPQVGPAVVQSAIASVQAIYEQNVFPAMKVTWGTYPNNIGHTDFPGCFRCHDGNHASADGKTISNDCSTCHDLPAVSEKDPKILADLGLVKNAAGGEGAQGK
jgi:hypothetical protein